MTMVKTTGNRKPSRMYEIKTNGISTRTWTLKGDDDENGELVISREDQTEEILETSLVLAKTKRRRHGVVSLPDDGKSGLSNLGFDYHRRDKPENGCVCETSADLRRTTSVTFNMPEFPILPLMKVKRGRELNPDELGGKQTGIPSEKSQDVLEPPGTVDKEIESYEDARRGYQLYQLQKGIVVCVVFMFHPRFHLRGDVQKKLKSG